MWRGGGVHFKTCRLIPDILIPEQYPFLHLIRLNMNLVNKLKNRWYIKTTIVLKKQWQNNPYNFEHNKYF